MVEDSEKELRFTRSAQAVPWSIAAACGVLFIVVSCISALLPSPWGAPALVNFWWVLIPVAVLTFCCGRIAWRCLKHAYLIFSPVGVEIFPFRKPEKNLDVVIWAQIDHLELKNGFLYLHYDADKTGGKAISLRPIMEKKWPLLKKVVELRAKKHV